MLFLLFHFSTYNSFEWKQYYTLHIRFHGLRLDVTSFVNGREWGWVLSSYEICTRIQKSLHKKKLMKNKWKVAWAWAGRIKKYCTCLVPDTEFLIPWAWLLTKFVINLPTNLYHAHAIKLYMLCEGRGIYLSLSIYKNVLIEIDDGPLNVI